MIKITGLDKWYNKGKGNEIHVIDNVTLTLPDTGIVTFLGESGSGKTTLLNALGGLDRAKGEIDYGDIDVKGYSPSKIDGYRQKYIGYVFQNYNLLPTLTVYDNLKTALEMSGITDEEEQAKRIEYTLKKVGMFKYRKKLASALSGGQQQRVSIARALVKNCKILIADEPTGNLDSENTLGVMNILKKVSKFALVILVTHEENIAYFFSDVIYRISDGEIISQEQGNPDATFENESSNLLYLKDMEFSESATALGSFKVYSENGTAPADFTVYFKNNTLYLDSSVPIKLVKDSSLNIIDGHRKAVEKEDLESFEYDTSFYVDKKDKAGGLKDFGKTLQEKFASFKAVSKKMRWMYFSLVLIGILFSMAAIMLTNQMNTFTITPVYNNNLYEGIVNQYFDYTNESFYGFVDSGDISAVTGLNNVRIGYQPFNTFRETATISEFDISQAVYSDDYTDLRYGEKPVENNEIVLSENLALRLADNGRTDFSARDMIGRTVFMGNPYYMNSNNSEDFKLKVTGISVNDSNMVYTNAEMFYKMDNYLYYGPVRADYYEGMSETDIRYLEYETGSYTLLEGSDDLGSDDVLVDSPSIPLGTKISVNSETKTVKGRIRYNEETNGKLIIIKDPIKTVKGIYGKERFLTGTEHYEIVKGTEPVNCNEILVPYNTNLAIGSFVSKELKVVGWFKASTEYMSAYIIKDINGYIIHNFGYNLCFSQPSANIRNYFEEKNIKLMTMFDALLYNQAEDMKYLRMVFGTVFSVLTVACAVLMYFVMRSKMIHDIYRLGVLRSLGAKRSRIIGKTAVESAILTLFTTMVGYVFGILLYVYASRVSNAFAGISILIFSPFISVISGLCLFAGCVLIGIIPIALLMLKTPSEILAKYDI